jgi:multidrug efflux pump subunit AcrA (membrane-fusion protein)
VYCTFKIQPAGAVNVYAKVPGRLVDIWVSPNQHVTKGQRLVSLESVDLNRQIVQLASAQTTAKANLALIRFASSRGDEGRGARLEESKAVVATATGNLEQRKIDHQMLEIKSPADGYLLAPPRVRKPKQSSKELSRWTGTPLEGKNMGAWVESQTVIGQIVPRLDQFDAVLAVDQKEIEFIQLHQSVELHLNQFPLNPFKSSIKTLSSVKMVETPAALSSKHGGELLSVTSAEGNDVPASTTYRVSVPLAVDGQPILSGGTGTAKISIGSQTVGQRVWRLLCHTFHFDL